MSDDDTVHGPARPRCLASSTIHGLLQGRAHHPQPVDFPYRPRTFPNATNIVQYTWTQPRIPQERFHQFVGSEPAGIDGRAKRKAPESSPPWPVVTVSRQVVTPPAATSLAGQHAAKKIRTERSSPSAGAGRPPNAAGVVCCQSCGKPGHAAWQCYSAKNAGSKRNSYCAGRKRKQAPTTTATTTNHRIPSSSSSSSSSSVPYRVRGRGTAAKRARRGRGK
jgi:hypothetical protein